MPNNHSVRRSSSTGLLALVAGLVVALLVLSTPAAAQDDPPEPEPPAETTTTLQPPIVPPTTEPPAPDPADPGLTEDLEPEEVPISDETVPPRPPEPGVYAAQAGRIVRQQLRVARAEAVALETAYQDAKQRVIDLDAELGSLEESLTGMAAEERAAIRQVEAARRLFEARTAHAVVRGSVGDLSALITTEDPNEIGMAQTMLSTILDADDTAVREYLAAKAAVSTELVTIAERLVAARLDLAGAREELMEARRASVAAQFNLAVFAAGSEIVIHGFVFPVGEPHTFGDSFGAPRMMGTGYEHAHQGTDILAPAGTPLHACERGIIIRMGSDVLGGTKLWLKGESGTYYYYAHLSAFAEGMADGTIVGAGDIVGYVGDTGNARGGPPHLHFEIHPGGGPAVNPYPLLKVVDELSRQARSRR